MGPENMTPSERNNLRLRAHVLLAAIALVWLALTLASFTVYLVADDWGCLERIMDHGMAWSFNPAVPGRVFYRPLTQDVFYRVMSAVAGLHPVAYHACNMIFHAANILMVIVLARKMTGKKEAALWAGLLFAANPGSFLTVNFVAGIQEIWMMNLALGAALCFIARAPLPPGGGEARAGRPLLAFLGPALYAASLFAKETAVWIPAWFWLHDLATGMRAGQGIAAIIRRRLYAHLPYDILLVLYFGMRMIVMPPPTEGLYQFSLFGPHLLVRIEEYMQVIAKAVGIPVLAGAGHFIVYAILGAAALATFISWSVKKRRLVMPVLMGLAWTGVGVLIFLPIKGRFYEYYISFALIGLFWALGYGLDAGLSRLGRARPRLSQALFAAFLAAVLISCGVNYARGHRDDFIMRLARATRTIHQDILAKHPSFPPHARIIIFSDIRVHGDPSHFGLRALYHQKDLQVILDEQAFIITREGNRILIKPRQGFDYTGVYGFAYTERDGFVEIHIGADGSLPFTAEVPAGP